MYRSVVTQFKSLIVENSEVPQLSILCNYDGETEILFVTSVGKIEPEDFVEFLGCIEKSEDFGMDVSTIWDMRQVDFAEFDQSIIRKMLKAKEQHKDRKKAHIASVVATDLGFGMSRMYQILSNLSGTHPEDRFAVYHDVPTAIDWIVHSRTVV